MVLCNLLQDEKNIYDLAILTFIFSHFWQLETSKSLFSIFLFSKKKTLTNENLKFPYANMKSFI